MTRMKEALEHNSPKLQMVTFQNLVKVRPLCCSEQHDSPQISDSPVHYCFSAPTLLSILTSAQCLLPRCYMRHRYVFRLQEPDSFWLWVVLACVTAFRGSVIISRALGTIHANGSSAEWLQRDLDKNCFVNQAHCMQA